MAARRATAAIRRGTSAVATMRAARRGATRPAPTNRVTHGFPATGRPVAIHAPSNPCAVGRVRRQPLETRPAPTPQTTGARPGGFTGNSGGGGMNGPPAVADAPVQVAAVAVVVQIAAAEESADENPETKLAVRGVAGTYRRARQLGGTGTVAGAPAPAAAPRRLPHLRPNPAQAWRPIRLTRRPPPHSSPRSRPTTRGAADRSWARRSRSCCPRVIRTGTSSHASTSSRTTMPRTGSPRRASDSATLTVGTKAWPLPFPIVRTNGVWYFDAEAGAQELAYRRIGHNELDAMKVVRALVGAQKPTRPAVMTGRPSRCVRPAHPQQARHAERSVLGRGGRRDAKSCG